MEVAGEAESGSQAIASIRELRPDAVLLDIRMPGCSGIDVAASLGEPRPRIVFCTAFEEYAVDAFELAAVDYLLKPVSRARLGQALDRLRAMRGGPAQPELDVLARRVPVPASRFLARSGAHYLVIEQSAVEYFESEDGLTRLVGAGGRYWMDPTLNELELRLDPRRFFRVSRAAIVNMDCVAKVVPGEGGTGWVLMKNGERLAVSRRRYRELLHALYS